MFPKEMTLASRQLFEYFYVVADKHNTVLAPMSEITERTDLSSASIARAKSQLFEMGFLKQRANNIFMINPSKVFKGESDDRFNAYEEYEMIQAKKP